MTITLHGRGCLKREKASRLRTICVMRYITKQLKTMAKYVKMLQRNHAALVPENKVNAVTREAQHVGIIAMGGAIEKTRNGLYRWLYAEAA